MLPFTLSLINCLFVTRCPPHITYLVMAIIIYSIECIFRRWFWPNMSDEFLKTSKSKFYPTASIIGIACMAMIKAAILGTMEDLIFRGHFVSASMPVNISRAATTYGLSASQGSSWNYFSCPAVTNAAPHSSSSLAHSNRSRIGLVCHNKAAESLAQKIDIGIRHSHLFYQKNSQEGIA